MPDERAELMAVQYSGELVAPRDLYNRFHRDLNKIEAEYRELIVSYIDSMGYREYFIDERGNPHVPFFPVYRGFIYARVVFDSASAERVVSGEHAEFNDLTDRLGVGWQVNVEPNAGITGPLSIRLELNDRLHPARTLDAISSIDGVTNASYTSIYPDGWDEEFRGEVRPTIWVLDGRAGGYNYVLSCSTMLQYGAMYFGVSRTGDVELIDIIEWGEVTAETGADRPWFTDDLRDSARKLRDLGYYSVSR